MDSTFMSPKRCNGFLVDSLSSPPIKETAMLPWNWGIGAQKIDFSPASSCGGSPHTPDQLGPGGVKDKRGRPRMDSISTLIKEGAKVDSVNKCHVCNRVFPREKSLQAHLRTHTGERPYLCDFPGCKRKFAQSGQLKTHQRLHTGEKPFVCSETGCNVRFAHSNRHCPHHPKSVLKKLDGDLEMPLLPDEETSPQVQAWLKMHVQRRQERTPLKCMMHTKRPNTKRSLSMDIENQWLQDQNSSPLNHEDKPQEQLELPLDLTSPSRPVSIKKMASPLRSSANESPCGKQFLIPLTPKSCWTRSEFSPRKLLPLQALQALQPVSPRKQAEHQNRLMGALALIELAQS